MSIQSQEQQKTGIPTNAAAPDANKPLPEDVPDEELEAVAGGWGHHRWYHHDHWGRRGYYRNGAFIQLNL